uniref:Uncharacterized protein n=1 Tax=Anguilla anguilla TaxID=7936 RepID=A0A0E9WLA0_ANGAN
MHEGKSQFNERVVFQSFRGLYKCSIFFLIVCLSSRWFCLHVPTKLNETNYLRLKNKLQK